MSSISWGLQRRDGCDKQHRQGFFQFFGSGIFSIVRRRLLKEYRRMRERLRTIVGSNYAMEHHVLRMGGFLLLALSSFGCCKSPFSSSVWKVILPPPQKMSMLLQSGVCWYLACTNRRSHSQFLPDPTNRFESCGHRFLVVLFEKRNVFIFESIFCEEI